MLDATRLRVLVAVARHGSVTAAAQALNYAQPSISHHMARLEAETGAKLMERSGRGIKLTEAGLLLAERAQEILGRLDAAEAELAAHVGLRCEQVRVAAFGSALAALVPAAGAALIEQRPGAAISVTQAGPAEAIRMLRAGQADIALVFRYAITSGADRTADRVSQIPEGQIPDDGQIPGGQIPDDGQIPGGQIPDDGGLGYTLLHDEPVLLLTPEGPGPPSRAARGLADVADRPWVVGCPICEDVLTRLARRAGFAPKITSRTADYVAAQAFVAAGLGATIAPGLVLRAVRLPGVGAVELAGVRRQVFAVSYGQPAKDSAPARFIRALTGAAG
ncbi:MAG: LysR family transcriptional regulator [Actinomycetota bacterium]|nr:LysR family transcriptional regulator [Actinomycetota bacterium]